MERVDVREGSLAGGDLGTLEESIANGMVNILVFFARGYHLLAVVQAHRAIGDRPCLYRRDERERA